MGRAQRIHFDGALYHVMARGNDQQSIFEDDYDRLFFIQRLHRVKTECPVRIYSYCLMSNHIHLMVRVGKTPLSEVMQRLLTAYAHYFNRKWDRRGHLFEGRYRDILCMKDTYFKELIRYINLNPVAAGLVLDPGHWRWSSYSALIGTSADNLVDSDFVGKVFGSRDAIRDFILKRGEASWNPNVIKNEQVEFEAVETARDMRVSRDLDEIANEVARQFKIRIQLLPERGRAGVLRAARRRFIVEAYQEGHRNTEIARYLKRSLVVVSRITAAQNVNNEGNVKPDTYS